MKKILAFGASTSSKSINKKLATYAASLVKNHDTDVIDLRDFYPCAMFSIDEEEANGFPANAIAFRQKLLSADGFIVSIAEHNGAYSAAFKNLFDWASRMEGKVWNNKPVLITGTSPGGRGAGTAIDIAAARWKFNGASDITGTFSLPSFHDHFSSDNGITQEDKRAELEQRIAELESAV